MNNDQFSGVQGDAAPDNTAPLADLPERTNVGRWGNLMPTRAMLEAAAKDGGFITPQFRAQLDALRDLDEACAKAWAALDNLDWVGDAAAATSAVWAGMQAYGWTRDRLAQKYGFTRQQIDDHLTRFGYAG